MAETSSGFAGLVGWHMSQISFRLQQLTQGGEPDFVAADEVGQPERLKKILKVSDATRIYGGSLLFHAETENVQRWLLVDIRGKRLPILDAKIHSIIVSDRDSKQFVHDVYYKILGRQADDVGLDLYMNHLAAGNLTRSSFVEVIASSGEALEKNRPMLFIAYPNNSLDNIPEDASEEDVINTLSITVTDI